MRHLFFQLITFIVICGCMVQASMTFSWQCNESHKHNFCIKCVNDAYLKTAGDGYSGAEYYYKCNQCLEKGDTSFIYGSSKEPVMVDLSSEKLNITGDTIADETQQGMALHYVYAYVARVTDIDKRTTETLINRVNLQTGKSELMSYDGGKLKVGVANDLEYVQLAADQPAYLFIAPASYSIGNLYRLTADGTNLTNRVKYKIVDEEGKKMVVSSVCLKEVTDQYYVMFIRQNSILYELDIPLDSDGGTLTATEVMNFSKPDDWPIEGIYYKDGKIITTVRDDTYLKGMIIVYDLASKSLEKTYNVLTDPETTYYEIETIGYANDNWYINLNKIVDGVAQNGIEILQNFDLSS